jgi:hypothetical protein
MQATGQRYAKLFLGGQPGSSPNGASPIRDVPGLAYAHLPPVPLLSGFAPANAMPSTDAAPPAKFPDPPSIPPLWRSGPSVNYTHSPERFSGAPSCPGPVDLLASSAAAVHRRAGVDIVDVPGLPPLTGLVGAAQFARLPPARATVYSEPPGTVYSEPSRTDHAAPASPPHSASTRVAHVAEARSVPPERR